MARRRLYVFGTIIVLGLLIGIFCLPKGVEQPEVVVDPEPPAPGDVVVVDPVIGAPPLPPLRTDGGSQPASPAQLLVIKARQQTLPQTKYKLLNKAYQTDPRGRWGGQAAAEMGDIHTKLNNTEKARLWYGKASRASLVPETDARVGAALTTTARPRPPLSSIKLLTYKVQPGDSLWKIARRYATSVGAIKKANNLTKNMIRVGKTLRIPKGPFDILVSKSKHTLQLLQDNKTVKIYRVGLGRDNGTPTGSFVVNSKLIDPVWYSNEGRIPADDPRNVLGSRWIGFSGRIGIHGTRKSEAGTIGKNMSDGCIRMLDADVKELYGFIVEGKSKVTVVE